MVIVPVDASVQTSRLGALYDRVYATICGEHPSYRPWHFQYLFLAEAHLWQRSRMTQLKGRVLDVGCGRRPYEAWVSKGTGDVSEYVGLDVTPGPGVNIVVDPNGDWPLDDASVDAILLTQVLEHVADRKLLAKEIGRVLRPGGTLLLTVPFIFPLHGLPHDYARFTPHGVRELFVRDFEIVELVGLGRAGAAMGNLLLTFIETSLNSSRFLRLLKGLLLPLWIPFCLAINVVCRLIDWCDVTGAYPTNTAMVARRRPV